MAPDDDDIKSALDAAWDDSPPATQAADTKKEPHITTRLASAAKGMKTPPAFRVESPSFVAAPPRVPQRTVTNEVELENARRRSARLSDIPAKSMSEGSLNRAQLLSLADDAPPFAAEDMGGALDLVDQQAPPSGDLPGGDDDPVREMRDRFSLGDYSGALFVAESLLEEDPAHAEAQRYADNCRGVLAQMYTARIGPLDRVPFIAVPGEQLKWLSIDHRAGFVLSHVDGISSLEQILDVSGMPALDALRILYELAQQRVISFR